MQYCGQDTSVAEQRKKYEGCKIGYNDKLVRITAASWTKALKNGSDLMHLKPWGEIATNKGCYTQQGYPLKSKEKWRPYIPCID